MIHLKERDLQVGKAALSLELLFVLLENDFASDLLHHHPPPPPPWTPSQTVSMSLLSKQIC